MFRVILLISTQNPQWLKWCICMVVIFLPSSSSTESRPTQDIHHYFSSRLLTMLVTKEALSASTLFFASPPYTQNPILFSKNVLWFYNMMYCVHWLTMFFAFSFLVWWIILFMCENDSSIRKWEMACWRYNVKTLFILVVTLNGIKSETFYTPASILVLKSI